MYDYCHITMIDDTVHLIYSYLHPEHHLVGRLVCKQFNDVLLQLWVRSIWWTPNTIKNLTNISSVRKYKICQSNIPPHITQQEYLWYNKQFVGIPQYITHLEIDQEIIDSFTIPSSVTHLITNTR